VGRRVASSRSTPVPPGPQGPPLLVPSPAGLILPWWLEPVDSPGALRTRARRRARTRHNASRSATRTSSQCGKPTIQTRSSSKAMGEAGCHGGGRSRSCRSPDDSRWTAPAPGRPVSGRRHRGRCLRLPVAPDLPNEATYCRRPGRCRRCSSSTRPVADPSTRPWPTPRPGRGRLLDHRLPVLATGNAVLPWAMPRAPREASS
jgi:hypothetical protein